MLTLTAFRWLVFLAGIAAAVSTHGEPASFSAVSQPVTNPSSGDQFMAEVLATLQRRASVSARLRHQARIFGDTLRGSGKYWQRGVGAQQVTRWEMQTQLADTTASYVQVFDGNHLWTDRTLPSGRKVHRLDVNRLQVRRRTAPAGGKSSSPSPDWAPLLATASGQGGLAEMLADLLRRFTFAPPRAVQLDGLAVYALVGKWRRPELEKLWPELAKAEAPPTWPRQLPHHVLVLVGKSNWFPYVIEHRRAGDAPLATSATGDRPTRDPLLRYEIFEVQFAAALDDTLFQFKPGDVPWSDETSLVLQRLRGKQGFGDNTP